MKKKKYELKNECTGETIHLTLEQILKEINRDRSKYWQNYNKRDWKEGLQNFTEYTLKKGKRL